jgi:hypothetical protein
MRLFRLRRTSWFEVRADGTATATVQENHYNPAGLAYSPRRVARAGTVPQCVRPILNALGVRVYPGETRSQRSGTMSFLEQETHLTPCPQTHLRDERIAGHERLAKGLALARARAHGNH